MQFTFRSTNFGFLLSGIFLLAGCTTVPKEKQEITDAEMIQKLPEASRTKIFNLLLADFTRPVDPQVDRYLTAIATRVVQKKGISQDNSLKAYLVKSEKKNEGTLVWTQPPDRVLIESRLVRALEFENEIAAAIAFSWEQTQDVLFQERFLTEVQMSEPNLQKIYEFSEAESLRAVETSVDLLYVSRYDPRGLVSYFEKLKNLNQGNSETIRARLNRLQEKARRTIAYYPPLLNPTIRTQEFYRIRKRLEKL